MLSILFGAKFSHFVKGLLYTAQSSMREFVGKGENADIF